MILESRDRRRVWICWIFIIVFLVFQSFGVNQVFAAAPNLIFLLTDDQRADTLGAYGNDQVQTPHLDQLADEGVVFENMFVTTSICATSRASILLGQFGRRHRIWKFGQELTSQQFSHSYLGRLKSAGYYLGFIGKWGVGNPPPDYFDYDRAFAGQGKYFIQVDGERRHLTSVMGDQILEFLEKAPRDQPFCLSVSFKAPHVQDSYKMMDVPFPYDPELEGLYQDTEFRRPLSADPKYFEGLPTLLQNSENRLRWAIRFWGPRRTQESLRGYHRLIAGVDRVVGRLIQALRREGRENSTAIVFSGDNGFFLGELGLASKFTPHEVSIRVPLIIKVPKAFNLDPGRFSEIALNIDIAPTLLDLAGLPPEPRMQGKSLLKLMRGKVETWRREFFYEHLFEHPRIPRMEGVRTERWKYIRFIDTDPLVEELYDLESDPQEVINLTHNPEYEKELMRLREKWKSQRKAVE